MVSQSDLLPMMTPTSGASSRVTLRELAAVGARRVWRPGLSLRGRDFLESAIVLPLWRQPDFGAGPDQPARGRAATTAEATSSARPRAVSTTILACRYS